MGTDFTAYRAIDAVNWSSLKNMSKSPLHYKHGLTHDRPDTPAMALGRAVHKAVLEPRDFPLTYTVWRGFRRGKDWTTFKSVNEEAGLEVLTDDEYDKCLAIQTAIEQHPVAGPLLTGGEAEKTLLWTDCATGLECKARADYIRRGTLIDLKTTRSLDERDFQRTYHGFKYNCQLAMYLAGLSNGGFGFDALIVAVEADPPHDVAVFRPSEDSLYAGAQEVAELLERVADCTETGLWPGAYPLETELDLPQWYYAVQERDIEALGIDFGGHSA